MTSDIRFLSYTVCEFVSCCAQMQHANAYVTQQYAVGAMTSHRYAHRAPRKGMRVQSATVRACVTNRGGT